MDNTPTIGMGKMLFFISPGGLEPGVSAKYLTLRVITHGREVRRFVVQESIREMTRQMMPGQKHLSFVFLKNIRP